MTVIDLLSFPDYPSSSSAHKIETQEENFFSTCVLFSGMSFAEKSRGGNVHSWPGGRGLLEDNEAVVQGSDRESEP